MRCAGWDVVVPEKGEVKCSFDGINADPGATCSVTCDQYYVTEVETIRCLDGWVPTRNPECTPDGSLTVIIVPSVVGSIFVLFLVVFIYVKTSNRCQSSTRAHDEDDVEKGIADGRRRNGQNYMMKTSHRPGAHSPQNKEKAKTKNKKKSLKKKSRNKRSKIHTKTLTRKWRRLSVRQTLSARMRNGKSGATLLMRRGIKNVRSPWRRKGPRRVVGNPNGVGKSSMCEDLHLSNKAPSPVADASSCCSSCSSMLCPNDNPNVVCGVVPKDEVIIPPSDYELHSLPPLRPPAPKVDPRRGSLKTNAKILKRVGAEIVEKKGKKISVSSGYSSDEKYKKKRRQKIYEAEEKRKRRKKRSAEKKRHKQKQKSEEDNTSPFNNYPVCASDRQYQDFENDYRKNGHIFDGGAYHPQYQHHIKSYPVKPVRKKNDGKKISDDEEDDENKKPPVSTGGVKYYAIKQDKDEIKILRRNEKKYNSRSVRSKNKRHKATRHKSKDRKTKPRGRDRQQTDTKSSKQQSRSKKRSKKRNKERS